MDVRGYLNEVRIRLATSAAITAIDVLSGFARLPRRRSGRC